jgi:hypothetical protein
MCNKQIKIELIVSMMELWKIELEDIIKAFDVKSKPEIKKEKKQKPIFTGRWGDDAVEEDFFNQTILNSKETIEEVEETVEEVEETVEEVEETVKEVEETVEEVEETVEEVEETVEETIEETVEETVEETIEEVNKNSWKSVVSSSKPKKEQNLYQQKVKKQVHFENNKKNVQVIYTLQEFLQAISQKQKLHIDFEIDDSAHCPHSYEGTLCKNVRECGRIHIQRCIHNLNCYHKNCPYLHETDMPTEEAKDNFAETMEHYNYIKKHKRVST